MTQLATCIEYFMYKYPAKDVETLFVWGNKTIMKDSRRKEEVIEFISLLLMEFMTQFKIKYEPISLSEDS